MDIYGHLPFGYRTTVTGLLMAIRLPDTSVNRMPTAIGFYKITETNASLQWIFYLLFVGKFRRQLSMSRKGPKVGLGMLDFVEDCCLGVKSQ